MTGESRNLSRARAGRDARRPLSGPSADEVHVWTVPLDVDEGTQSVLESLLLADERARADRVRSAEHRRRFVVCRASMRLILAAYLGADPSSLQFDYGPHGKPTLRPAAGAALTFNVSHSGEQGVVAVGCERAVGVDIEHLDGGVAGPSIAQRYFHPRERAALAAVAAALRQQAFFRCWVRKEAYAKARGGGLVMGLDRFAAPASPDVLPSAWSVVDEVEAASVWSGRDLDVHPRYAAAVVAEGMGWQVRRMAFCPEEMCSMGQTEPSRRPSDGRMDRDDATQSQPRA